MAKKHFGDFISTAQTEEELKFYFAKYFDLPVSTKNRIDLYTAQILFEFKLADNLKSTQILAKTVAQALYYIRRLKFGDDERAPSENICVVTKNFAAFFQTKLFADFYNDKSVYDWDLKPSAPCKKLVADLAASEIICAAHVYDFSVMQAEIAFVALISNTRKRQSALANVKKQITAQNFYQVFQYWQSFFGAAVENGHKTSEYFIADIEASKSHMHDGKIYFELAGEQIKVKVLNPDEYNYFWARHAKIGNARDIISIRQKMDRMTEIDLRRRTGEFYTPIEFAKKAVDYLLRTVTLDGNYRIWDMAAGTGNLEFALPPDAVKFCYISTLLADEANYCKQIFSDATVFQYDFLNDGADKLPKNLREDLNNPEIKWIIFINPPYATASNYEREKGKNKFGVSFTEIRKQMLAENLGKNSSELFSQFIYRISRDFADKIARLGIFSKLTYIIAGNEQKFRDKIFRYKFERGFVFNSRNFDGCNGQFPVGFLVWNLAEHISLEEQTISLDVYDSDVEKIAEKTFKPARNDEVLNKWIKYRPKCTKKFPPTSSGIKIAPESKSAQKVAEGFLASFMLSGNDFSNQNYTAFLSGAVTIHGNLSVTPENFEQCMITHMVRRLPKATWLNDRDQFLQPTKKLPPEFVTDAAVWSLFAPSNQTVSLRNVEYAGELYQIRNNFYPFLLAEVREWKCSSLEMAARLELAREDRFAALWLSKHELSAESAQIVAAARELYKKFYAESTRLDLQRWKIADWDAGWYQIRMALGESTDLSALSAKLLPQIYELGFLRNEVRYF